jgi:hypothetical protein
VVASVATLPVRHPFEFGSPTTNVEFRSPRDLRSASSPAIGLSTARALAA